MNLEPLSNNVLIEIVDEEKETESGIIIPDTASQKGPAKGKVVAVGPGRKNEKGEIIPLSVKVGDKVLFNKGFSSNELNKKQVVIKEDEIIGIIK